jgi:hypothetical protein
LLRRRVLANTEVLPLTMPRQISSLGMVTGVFGDRRIYPFGA